MGKKPCPICKKLLTNVKRHLENKKKCEPPKEISNEIVENLPIIEPEEISDEIEESEQIKNVPIVEVEVMKEYIDEETTFYSHQTDLPSNNKKQQG